MSTLTRRSLLHSVALGGASKLAATAPAPPVAVERCLSYNPRLLVETLDRMFDRLGGLAPIVRGKTVAIKVNMTGTPGYRNGRYPIEMTGWTHPEVIRAAIHLMERAGAHRFRILESPWKSAEPIEDVMLKAGWDPGDFQRAAKRVEFENTNYLGQGKHYHRLKVPYGGLLFPAFDLNHSYVDCDAFVSIAKMKEHQTAGITLAMKNCFGNTPCTIYGDHAGEKEPLVYPKGG
ncbi:MAG: DUF362 domain-containing protein, partial [bacterium]|nr:DUF362 domain-containing protein [bacterium]